jgi:leucyl-tRNA synthetase
MEPTKVTRRRYDFKTVEARWQKQWADSSLYRAPERPDPKNKFYILVMFAYPSGDIHMGHFRNYIIGDAVARYQMMLGKDVLHPFGWDAFGLPAENAAIKRNIHPQEWTYSNIGVSRATLQKVGISFDWSREIVSSNPDYYKWTQWLFLQMFKRGLAYRHFGYVNWCPTDNTVLANEQVKDGKCDRCGTVVEKKKQEQWYFRITDYADRLLDGLDKLPNWPEGLKSLQRNWIGKSTGAEIEFKFDGGDGKLTIFTTRPDTIFGVSFMAVAPESEMFDRVTIPSSHAEEVSDYRAKAMMRSEIDRATATADKDGVFTGLYALNPFNGEKVQVWVADYVLPGYGTGAVMGVPAHDTRDFAFAKKYNLPIKVVIKGSERGAQTGDCVAEAFTEYGPMVNSGKFDGLSGEAAIAATIGFAEQGGFGRARTQYKLKDWSVSRQRYWGCPIPIIHCKKCGPVAVDESQLPVALPMVDNYKPKGRSPLADVPEFMNTKCPKCGGDAERDPDTMDTFMCSSWYYLRYLDPSNSTLPFDKEMAARWLPIDLYIGGITHAVGHLLYYRFVQKFLHDVGWLADDEPTIGMFNHGMVMDSKGEVMSKSKGNVVSPIELIESRGVDVTRLAMYFTAPSEREVIWSSDSLTGVEKFLLNRLVPLSEGFSGSKVDLKCYFNSESLAPSERELYTKLNQSIRRIGLSFDDLQFNTSVSTLMELLRDLEASEGLAPSFKDYVILKAIQLVAPFAPHLAEELWSSCGQSGSVFKSSWPVFDPSAVIADTIEIAVQVNGKLRDTVRVARELTQVGVEAAALECEKVKLAVAGKEIVKKIYVPGRILNIVVKG